MPKMCQTCDYGYLLKKWGVGWEYVRIVELYVSLAAQDYTQGAPVWKVCQLYNRGEP